jgi:hypothetical protein
VFAAKLEDRAMQRQASKIKLWTSAPAVDNQESQEAAFVGVVVPLVDDEGLGFESLGFESLDAPDEPGESDEPDEFDSFVSDFPTEVAAFRLSVR